VKANDHFCGLGGFTLAAEMEGIDVTFAANHNELAVKVFAANHRHTRLMRADLCGFDFESLEQFDMLLAGPACQPSSRAGQVGRKNSAKVYDDHVQMRATMWAVHECLRVCRPKFAVIENVPEVEKREDMDEWRTAIQALGYAVTDQPLLASRFGVPQKRWRRFYVCVHEGKPIAVQNPDVSEPGIGTIFDETAGGWVPIANMRKTVSKRGEPTARERVEYANTKLGGALGWGVHVSHRGAWGRSVSEPVTTLTTKAGQLWWVRDGMYRLWTKTERKLAMGFPADYDLLDANEAETAKLLGNAVPLPMAAGVLRHVLAAA
jgi:site-specific DNA-cytosine methylase